MIIAVFIFMEETGIGILLCIYYFLFLFSPTSYRRQPVVISMLVQHEI